MMTPFVQSVVHHAEMLLGSEYGKQIRKHAMRHEYLLQRLKRAVEEGDSWGVRTFQRDILRGFSSKLVCLVRSFKHDPGLTPLELETVAQELRADEDCGESIMVWAEPKASGKGWRPVCSFGPKRSALQLLVYEMLNAKFGDDPTNFLREGKGAEAAAIRIRELAAEDYEYFVLGDVKDFFRSAQHKALKEVTGLPAAVIRWSVLIGDIHSVNVVGDVPMGECTASLGGAAQEGLPQGSRTSQFIAGLLLGPALRQVASADRIVTHGDDFAVGASTMKEGCALAEALQGILESLPLARSASND